MEKYLSLTQQSIEDNGKTERMRNNTMRKNSKRKSHRDITGNIKIKTITQRRTKKNRRKI